LEEGLAFKIASLHHHKYLKAITLTKTNRIK
jgi:hypothetical protein